MTRVLAVALVAGVALTAALAPAGGQPTAHTFVPAAGHSVAGFAIDRQWLAIAEDPTAPSACPLVRLIEVGGGAPRWLTPPKGPTCQLGGAFWVRPGVRAIGEALLKTLWIVRNGTTAIAVKASTSEQEVVLAHVTGIDDSSGPFLGPVAATNWLRLFGDYTSSAGTLSGGVISGNDRRLWSATGPVLPLGLDDKEHAVSVGADGSIAMWQAHGARYGRVPDAHARAAAVDDGLVVVLRSDRPRLDVRQLSGRLVHSWPVAPGAAPLLDSEGGVAVYTAGRAVHELTLATGADRVVARAPAGTTLIDAQIEPGFLAYAYGGGPARHGRVVVSAR
jgi:hypothetical protein